MVTELSVVDVDPAVKDARLVAMTRILPKVNVTRPLPKTEGEEKRCEEVDVVNALNFTDVSHLLIYQILQIKQERVNAQIVAMDE